MDGIIESMDMGFSNLLEIVKDKEAWHAAVHGVTKSWTQLSNQTTTIKKKKRQLHSQHLSYLPNCPTLPMECVSSLNIPPFTLLGSVLNSVLWEAKNPHLVAVPEISGWPGM